MKNAYEVLKTINIGDDIDEKHFSRLKNEFQEDYLQTIDFWDRLKHHRKPAEFKTQIVHELYNYIQQMHQRPEMQDNDKHTGGYVATKVAEIWVNDKRLRSGYNAIKAYCQLRLRDFNMIAVHLAEYRALNKLVGKIKRAGNKKEDAIHIIPERKPLSKSPKGKIGFSSRYFEPLNILKSKVDAVRLFDLIHNEDKDTYSLPYLYGNYKNTIVTIPTASQIADSVKKYMHDNLFTQEEIKLLLGDLMSAVHGFGECSVNSLDNRIELASGEREKHLSYINECEKTILALTRIREILTGEFEAYYSSLLPVNLPVKKVQVPTIETPVELYQDVLKILSDYGRDLETKPNIYRGLSEESLRDHFLTMLTGRYEKTTATGETFNKGGKTDILLKDHRGYNLFLAECKWWTGGEGLQSTINQLFGRYLSWRDTQVALIFFVENKGFSGVLDQVEKEAARHSYFNSFLKKTGRSNFSFLFRQQDDERNEIRLEIMLFHFPQ
jgi:hypothetical protein